MVDAWIDIADAIEGLRSALTETIGKSRDERMHFQLEPVELTLQTVVTNEGHGKIGWKIIEAGGSRESARTQVVKLTLTPLWRESPDDAMERPLITGTLPGAASTITEAAAPERGVATHPDAPDNT